jgi:tetratricopeptide (TPR) repeat protein
MTKPTTLLRIAEPRKESLTGDLPPVAPVRSLTTVSRLGPAPTWIRAVLGEASEGRATPQPTPHEAVGLRREPVPLRPGHQIPGSRYRVVRWLGEGGMGVVYEAEHIDMQRRAAVKILRSEVCHNPAVVRAFRDEARAASRIQSDLIVQLYDFVELPDERLMIAMELLSGNMLLQELSQPMALSRAVGILRQVCRGLAAAHAAGVVHRDIKPENVFLTTKDGRADAVKLVDFGIAAIHDGTQHTAIRGGTPYYLAPEVVHGSVAASVDVYAWGCLAFELLTGRVPFDGSDTADVLRAHLTEPPPVPSSRRPEIPAALDAVILRCLEKDPDVRFPSMLEVEAALCEAQLEHGLRTSWDDLTLPLVDPERRARLAALLPKAPAPVKRRRSIVTLVAGAMLLLSSGAALEALAVRDVDGHEQLAAATWVEERGIEARQAAAEALFVFPPVDEPSHITAYVVVKTLEQYDGPERDAALTLATALRAELATTLARLGDEYWSKHGGRPFAVAYYDQALLFEPQHAVARDRSSLNEGEVEAFALRAETLAFSESELLGAEPLVVLAAHDAQSRTGELQALRERQIRRANELDHTLAQLCGIDTKKLADGHGRKGSSVPAAEAPAPAAPAAEAPAAGAPSVPADPSSDQVPASQVAGAGAANRAQALAAEREPTLSDRTRAKALTRKGRRLLASGDVARAEALFEQALGLDRRQVDAVAGLRDVEFERGAYHRAVRFGERAVRERPQAAVHRLYLGDAYYKVLRYRDALDQYELALALGEDRADWRIAKVRQKLGSL